MTDIKLKLRIRLLGLLCLVAGAPALAQQTITVNVTGKLKESACLPDIVPKLENQGGVTNHNLLELEKIKAHQLDGYGKTAGDTQILLRASGCTGDVNFMWVHFTSPNVDDDGRIIPSGSNALRFEIRNNDTSGSFIRVGGSATDYPGAQQGSVTAFSGSHPTNSNRVANKHYGVRYYAIAPVPAGTYVAAVTAHFKYY